MLFKENTPPRLFEVGNAKKFNIKDCGLMRLEDDEQITFITNEGAEYDVAKKNWGFYATPSLNGRLESFNLRSVIIVNKITRRFFLLLIERGKEESFKNYCNQESLEVVIWLDNSENCEKLYSKLKK